MDSKEKTMTDERENTQFQTEQMRIRIHDSDLRIAKDAVDFFVAQSDHDNLHEAARNHEIFM